MSLHNEQSAALQRTFVFTQFKKVNNAQRKANQHYMRTHAEAI